MERAEKRFLAIFEKINQSNVSKEKLKKLDVVKKLIGTSNLIENSERKISYMVFIGIFAYMVYFFMGLRGDDECFLEFPFDTTKVFRGPVNCDICINVTTVDKINNVSPDDFDKNYASIGKPVVITDGTKGWKAVDYFSFDFFKDLYQSTGNFADIKLECQFFPYKTEFKSLSDVLNMNPERARFEPGSKPWYIGWSNCNDDAGKILRTYYHRPYFLPITSENIALNWIFMGGKGSGAHMHVDDVTYPSWQAQIKGRKTWKLAPPPECMHKCQRMEITVEPGEIIVIDTNKWYHQTEILPGSISITIGAEFD
ncbi:uncharacterized protein [Onthophagus taurus]|uniref:uncharacterized protein n=1 Tax=Onthophagus taurus TaxID=166361 RepID=UPI000C206847|nr:uncharacterized protein LOC111418499 [Onthophagus taurus]